MTELRVGADETVEVACTVNGTPVTLSVPPRLTLADALRDRLGLTGTHLGCEHGVCGMCTVLVDGAAARSCLLFACQADGAEIVTVEGLGTPDAQHPLQAAFARHHALQCGFCTPGFLISSYDLLSRRPDVPEADLPTELSGVLCRCTGYRNIVAAVAEVAREHPAGVPPPGNCAPRTLLGRGGAVGSAPPVHPESESDGADQPAEIVLPQGEPTVRVSVTSELAAPLADVWAVLADVAAVARCLPGAELTGELGGDRYLGRARVALGPVRLAFTGRAQVTERDAGAHRLRVLAAGADAGAGQTQAAITLTAAAIDTATGPGTRLHAAADVHLTGRIAQFGRALAGDVSKRMFEQFATAVEQTAAGGAVSAPRMGAFALVAGATANRLRTALVRVKARLRRRRG